jgi:hypothetical protein
MSNKPEWLSGLGTLLLAGLAAYLAHRSNSTGEVAVRKDTLIGIASFGVGLLGWLSSWWVVYLRRDTKRERVRHAKDTGRRICPCTETGEIMLHYRHTEPDSQGAIPAIRCPRCKHWEVYDPTA